MTNIIPLDELQAKLELWQKRLRLADWDVTAKIVPMREMSNYYRCGEIYHFQDDKAADIKLLDPADYAKNAMRPYDMEQTLVHELLHLWTAPYDVEKDDTALQQAQEQLINAIATALVTLSREAHPPASDSPAMRKKALQVLKGGRKGA